MILELDGVTKYYKRFLALDGLTASVRPGAIGLLGPNGAGKSTLIKALLGLVRLTSGRAEVLGLDARIESRQIRERIGYMPEDDCSIAGLKGVESVALAGELAGLPALTSLRRAHEILDYVGVAEERYREVQTYSTGMRQKIKLAQALIHSPELVFLDEPTNGLDPTGRDKMLRLVRNLTQKKGVSVILSTHILSDIEACCDAALILGRGKLLKYDTIANLQRSVDPTYTVRVGGEVEKLRDRLQAMGFECAETSKNEVRVRGAGDLGSRVFDAARDSGTVVREIAASRTTLEEAFLEAVRETAGASQGAAAAPPPPPTPEDA